uniref:glutaminase n=1 Tax=Globodera rostochiensis TaxID=31243 RepID=A0A914IG90_GLORO
MTVLLAGLLPVAEIFQLATERTPPLRFFFFAWPRQQKEKFLSEKKTADRNYALSYMKENKCFPPDCATLREELDFYFQLCSLETHCTAAVMAATMANGDPHKVFTTPHPLVNAQQHNHQQRQSQFPYDGKRHFSNGFHAAPAKLGHKTVQAIDDHQLANELAAPGLQMICAPDCEPKAFVILIDFVYSDFDVRSLSVRGQLTDDNVMNALYAAKKYAIDAHGFWANSRSKHTVQAFNYAIVASDLGESGRLFNEICLDPNGKPHNPMINSGAIIVTSLLKKGVPMADRYDFSGSGRTRRLLLEEVGAMSVESPLTRRVQAVQTPHRLATR